MPLSEDPTQTLRLLADAAARGVRPTLRQTVSQWADAKRVLTRGAVKGPWRTDRTPHLREPMDALSEHDPTQEVVLWFGTQLGKTETGNNWVGSIIDNGLGDVMMVMPTSGAGKRSSKTRVDSLLEDTPSIAEKFGTSSRNADNTLQLKKFPGGFLMIAGANSPSDLKSEPVRFLFLDEVDEYPLDLGGQGHPIDLAKKRQDSYGSRRKTLITSTCTIKGKSAVERHYLASDRRRRWVPCPHCDAEQVLVWDGFRWDLDGEDVIDVWYECQHCGERIDERHKATMLPAGRWIPEAPGPGRAKGYHLPSWYAPLGFYSWLQVVSDRLKAERDPTGVALKLWLNTVAAETYTEATDTPAQSDLEELVEPYRVGTVPDGALLLTMGVDVQGNRLEATVYGWGVDGECWKIEHHILEGSPSQTGPGSVWEGLDLLFDRKYPHASGVELPIRAMGIDEGGHHTQEVRAYANARNTRARPVLSTKGASTRGRPIIGAPTVIEFDKQGKKLARGQRMYIVGADTAKHCLYNRLRATVKAHEDGRTSGGDLIHFPTGTPLSYFQQLTAEEVIERKTSSGFIKIEFRLPAGARNEALDCWVIAYAVAMHVGLRRINWKQLREQIEAEAAAARAEPEPPPPPPVGQFIARPPGRRNWVTGYRR